MYNVDPSSTSTQTLSVPSACPQTPVSPVAGAQSYKPQGHSTSPVIGTNCLGHTQITSWYYPGPSKPAPAIVSPLETLPPAPCLPCLPGHIIYLPACPARSLLMLPHSHAHSLQVLLHEQTGTSGQGSCSSCWYSAICSWMLYG